MSKRLQTLRFPALGALAAGLLVLTIGFLQGTSTANADGQLEWLRADGNRLVNETGHEVVLRGVNMENREWYWSVGQKHIDYERRAIPEVTRNWGANVILLAVASGPINRNDSQYLRFLDELVDLGKQNGAYTLLVYRYAEPNTGQSRRPNQAAEDAMARLAKRYASEPAVIYGLQVEPHRTSWSDLKPRFITMIDAIRAENPRALIAVPGTEWSRYIHHALRDPIPRENLMYKTHVYDPWGSDPGRFRLEEVAEKYPVIIGEFGAGGRTNLDDVRSLLDVAEKNRISWVGWLFHEKGPPVMLSSARDFTPNSYGREVKARLQAGAASNAAIAAAHVAEMGAAVADKSADAPEPESEKNVEAVEPVSSTVQGSGGDSTVTESRLQAAARSLDSAGEEVKTPAVARPRPWAATNPYLARR